MWNKDISVELTTEKETQKCNAVTGNSFSLVGVTESDQINKNKFLDEIKKVFDDHETSAQLTTAWNQLENAYRSARNSLKERIRNEKNSACHFYLYPCNCIYQRTLVSLKYMTALCSSFTTLVAKKFLRRFLPPLPHYSNPPPPYYKFLEKFPTLDYSNPPNYSIL